jgi:tryptophan synthase alpha chain
VSASLAEVFDSARSQNRAALIGYLPAGFPTVEYSAQAMCLLVESGFDAIEVGLPYSDPLMDGPVIQAAVEAALLIGTSTSDVLSVVSQVGQTGAPALVMSYWNPIERFGIRDFARSLASAGGSGAITPDLTPEEATEWVEATDAFDLDRVFLIAPTSTDERIDKIARLSNGFVYAASLMGVTGVRDSAPKRARELVTRARALTNNPIAVGLGVSTPEQVSEIATYADGVIVGSLLIRTIQEALARMPDDPSEAIKAVVPVARQLAAAKFR